MFVDDIVGYQHSRPAPFHHRRGGKERIKDKGRDIGENAVVVFHEIILPSIGRGIKTIDVFGSNAVMVQIWISSNGARSRYTST
jgi:hypothetical protein